MTSLSEPDYTARGSKHAACLRMTENEVIVGLIEMEETLDQLRKELDAMETRIFRRLAA